MFSCLTLWINHSIKFFSFNFPTGLKEYDVKIMCFNTHLINDKSVEKPSKIFEIIADESPDFLFLTEYYGTSSDTLANSLDSIYPYYDQSYRWDNNSGDVFYSRMKIDDIKLITPKLSGGNIYRVQISDNTDTLVIFCCHLSSNLVNQAKNLYVGIKDGYARRAKEAELLYNALSKEKQPTIVAGDLNDISGSYTLRKIESAGMYDSWWKSGLGYGCTYHKGGLYFRLDHILYSKNQFEICDIRVPYCNVSDHFPIVVNLKLK